jgi:hypothetical protein
MVEKKEIREGSSERGGFGWGQVHLERRVTLDEEFQMDTFSQTIYLRPQ